LKKAEEWPRINADYTDKKSEDRSRESEIRRQKSDVRRRKAEKDYLALEKAVKSAMVNIIWSINGNGRIIQASAQLISEGKNR
jgi:hypothetical protein